MQVNMNGKDLILYILQNDLENAPVFSDGRFLNFMTVMEAAIYYDVGPATIRTWVSCNIIPYIKIGDTILIPKTASEELKRKV